MRTKSQRCKAIRITAVGLLLISTVKKPEIPPGIISGSGYELFSAAKDPLYLLGLHENKLLNSCFVFVTVDGYEVRLADLNISNLILMEKVLDHEFNVRYRNPKPPSNLDLFPTRKRVEDRYLLNHKVKMCLV